MTQEATNGWVLRIEAVTHDVAALEALRDELVAAPSLDDHEREALTGRCDTYLGDLRGGDEEWWGGEVKASAREEPGG